MAEQPYATEDVLQKLLAEHPELQASDDASGEPRRWLLISREVGPAPNDSGAGRSFADHLFVDQDDVRNLVEVKRSSDTRVRREVLGQQQKLNAIPGVDIRAAASASDPAFPYGAGKWESSSGVPCHHGLVNRASTCSGQTRQRCCQDVLVSPACTTLPTAAKPPSYVRGQTSRSYHRNQLDPGYR
jgi:hypothetical protein